MRVVIDIESRSAANLKKVGTWVYAADPTTSITHVAYKFGAEATKLWRPLDGSACPADLMAALVDVDPVTTLVAHNAEFEREMLGGPPGAALGLPVAAIRKLDRWNCTASRAAAIGLPRTLEGSGAAMGLPIQKDKDGHRLMLQVCKPRKPRKDEKAAFPDWRERLFWWDDEPRMARMDAYCVRDVDAEDMLDRELPELSPAELTTWRITCEINERGVLFDADLLRAVPVLIEQAEVRLNAELRERTNGAVKAVTDTGALSAWLTAQGIDDHIDPTSRKASVNKTVVAAMIDNPEIDPLIRAVLEIRRDGASAGAKKWRAISARVSPDGRVRGVLVYCGASSTGRWSSRGVQAQNFVRGGTIKNIDGAIDALKRGLDAECMEAFYGPPLIVAAEMQRPAIISPPGALMARGDLSQIEARVNPWLAGAAWKIDAFNAYDAGTGPDLYKICAGGILGKPVEAVTKDERQGQGKVPELALGFGGGAGALQNSAKAYRVIIPRHPREENGLAVKTKGGPAAGTDEWIKLQWRANNPEIVGLWLGLETSALECMAKPLGEVVEVWTMRRTWIDGEPVVSRMHKTPLTWQRNSRVLTMRLPSGRRLYYWTPRVRKIDTHFGQRWTLFYRSEDSVTHRWTEFAAWGGLLCENAVQAVARDIMREGLILAYSTGLLRPVLLVHDELVVEVSGMSRDEATALVTKCITAPVVWAPGLPVSAEASAGFRYVKE